MVAVCCCGCVGPSLLVIAQLDLLACLRRYIAVQIVVHWLQKHARRLSACNQVDNLRSQAMLQEEAVCLETIRTHELRSANLPVRSQVAPMAASVASPSPMPSTYSVAARKSFPAPRAIASNTVKLDRLTRLVVGIDVTFDISDAYPNGWLQTVSSFVQQLRETENKTINMVAMGGQHTVRRNKFHR